MFSDPVKNLKTLALREDDIVADLGAGTGFYSIALGHIIPRGKVYAVDIVRDFLTTIRNKAVDARLNNIEILWGNVEKPGGTLLGDERMDAVVASNVLFQIEDKESFIEEIKRILKPKGRVLFLDWSPESSVFNLKKGIPKDKAFEMFERKGFMLQQDINTGEHHYGMILIKL
jgi:ubiquinone/menaquinone biosynthesis C-methylase UbiE